MFSKKFPAAAEVISVNLHEQPLRPDPTGQQAQVPQPGQQPQQGAPAQPPGQAPAPGQQQNISPQQAKLQMILNQKQKEMTGLKKQQIDMQQTELDNQKKQMDAQAKAPQQQPAGGAYMKNDKKKDRKKETKDVLEKAKLDSMQKAIAKRLNKKEEGLLSKYSQSIAMANDLLGEQNLMMRPVDSGPNRNTKDDINDADDVSAIKNKTILKHMGFEVGKDDQVQRAERILMKFEKIIPKLKQAIQTIRQRLMQNEMGQQAGMNMRDKEWTEASDKARKREISAMASDPLKGR